MKENLKTSKEQLNKKLETNNNLNKLNKYFDSLIDFMKCSAKWIVKNEIEKEQIKTKKIIKLKNKQLNDTGIRIHNLLKNMQGVINKNSNLKKEIQKLKKALQKQKLLAKNNLNTILKENKYLYSEIYGFVKEGLTDEQINIRVQKLLAEKRK